MKFSEVLQQAADSSFIHPEGKKVPVKVTAAVYKQSKNGNPMLEVQLKVVGGPNAGKGRPIRYWMMMEFDTTIQQITNLGIRKGELDQLGQYDVEQAGERLAALMVGRTAAADIIQEPYNNQMTNKIKWLNPAQGTTGPQTRPAPPATQEPSVKEETAEESELERLERELAAAKAEGSTRRTPAPDDLPF